MLFFANKTSIIPENTVKLNIQIQNWPFKSLQNELVLELRTHDSKSTSQNDCNSDSATSQSGNLLWTTSISGNTALYLQ